MNPPAVRLKPWPSSLPQRSVAPVVYVLEWDEVSRRWLGELVASVKLEVRSFQNVDELLMDIDTDAAGCIVTNMYLPRFTALRLFRCLQESGVDLPVVVLADPHDTMLAVGCIKAGAADVLVRPVSQGVMIDALLGAIDTHQAAREQSRLMRRVGERLATLSPRERQITDAIVAGQTNKAIAYVLGISVKTVEFHRAHVMDKMHVNSVAELVRTIVVHRHVTEESEGAAFKALQKRPA